jgi:hypothetical protein
MYFSIKGKVLFKVKHHLRYDGPASRIWTGLAKDFKKKFLKEKPPVGFYPYKGP